MNDSNKFAGQQAFIDELKKKTLEHIEETGAAPLAMIQTYGCPMNS